MGFVYSSLGQYQEAVSYAQQAVHSARAASDTYEEITALNNLGLVYERLGDYQQAIETYQQALTMTREFSNFSISLELSSPLGLNLGLNSFFDRIDHDDTCQQAVQAFQDVQEELNGVYEARHEIRSYVLEGRILSNLVLANSNLGNYEQAIQEIQQALTIAREHSDWYGESHALNNLGFVYSNLEDYQKAIEFYQQQLAIVRDVGDRPGEGSALSNLGAAFLASGDVVQAETLLFEAIEVLESLRTNELAEDQRISLLDTQSNTFQLLQHALVIQDKAAAALEIAERGRSRVFFEELVSRFGSESDAPLDQMSSPDIDQLRQISREQNATLVQYSIIQDEELYIYIVQPTGNIDFRSVNLQGQSLDIAELVESARTSMGVSRLLAWGAPEPTRAVGSVSLNERLKQLHQLLIAPIADLLPTDPNQLVIFIPQDELFLVPFAALQDAYGTYLIDRHTILTAPAIQVLNSTQARQQQVWQRQIQQPTMRASLVIGNPTMPLLSLVPGEEPVLLENLPGAEEEAREIAYLLGTDPLLGHEATKAVVVEQMPRARIIHFATHGILDEFQGLSGGVVLAADGTAGFNDGLLTAAEIAQMELNAEMVVLSACNTGQGRITGDGVLGLSRAFMLAGVPTVVVSLWAVPDAPTSELMEEFYWQLEVTDNKAQALRQAMINIRNIYPDPVNWAAFTIIGEAD